MKRTRIVIVGASLAGATAQDMHSAVERARVAVDLAIASKGLSPYLSEFFHFAEDDA